MTEPHDERGVAETPRVPFLPPLTIHSAGYFVSSYGSAMVLPMTKDQVSEASWKERDRENGHRPKIGFA